MSEHVDPQEPATEHPSRRRLLEGGAAVVVGAWAVPVVTSMTAPAAAASAAPSGGPICRTQTFLEDRNGAALVFGPGQERGFGVALGVTFAEVSSITVRLYQSADDPIDSNAQGAIVWQSEDTTSLFGVAFYGPAPDPLVMSFVPGGGTSTETYADLLQDGTATLFVEHDSRPGDTFTLDKVVVEVCGTQA